MDIQTILENKEFEVRGLLRRHNIAGDLNIDTIKKAHDAKGDYFMMDLLQILTPTSNYTALLEPRMASIPTPLMGTQSVNAPTAIDTESGKGWKFWDNLLNYANKTGETIGNIKQEVSGTQAIPQNGNYQQQPDNKMLYYIAAGFVALIIIILIFKK
jgi:hypothetical protein